MILKRLRASIATVVYVFKNPDVLNNDVFEMAGKLLEFVTKVAEEQRPYMTKFGLVNLKTKEKFDIVSIWAGPGIGADPYDRIAELVKENDLLKDTLGSESLKK